MRESGIEGVRLRRRHRTTVPDLAAAKAPGLTGRYFTADKSNTKYRPLCRVVRPVRRRRLAHPCPGRVPRALRRPGSPRDRRRPPAIAVLVHAAPLSALAQVVPAAAPDEPAIAARRAAAAPEAAALAALLTRAVEPADRIQPGVTHDQEPRSSSGTPPAPSARRSCSPTARYRRGESRRSASSAIPARAPRLRPICDRPGPEGTPLREALGRRHGLNHRVLCPVPVPCATCQRISKGVPNGRVITLR